MELSKTEKLEIYRKIMSEAAIARDLVRQIYSERHNHHQTLYLAELLSSLEAVINKSRVLEVIEETLQK